MSTKRLSRTVIEGGRYFGNSDDRRASNTAHRAAVRAHLRGLRGDPELAEGALSPMRKHVNAYPRDKLAAAERWLFSRVGRSWRRVKAEILSTFETRTIAGQHIVYGHLLPAAHPVSGEGRDGLTWRVHRRHVFFVDRRGILRSRSPHRRPQPFAVYTASAALIAFLAGRRVVVQGERVLWLHPTDATRRDGTRRYRQGRELDAREWAVWETLWGTEREYAQNVGLAADGVSATRP